MPQRISIGNASSSQDKLSNNRTKSNQLSFMGRQVGPAVLIVVIVLVVLALGLLIHNLMGPGKISASEQKALAAVQQAAQGNWEPLEQEDAKRKQRGEPPVQLPSWLHKPTNLSSNPSATPPQPSDAAGQ